MRPADQLRNQSEVGNTIAFHNVIQTLNVGQGCNRATQEQLARDLDAEQLCSAQEDLLEAMKKQLCKADASRDGSCQSGGARHARDTIPNQAMQGSAMSIDEPDASFRPKQAGAGPSTSESEPTDQGDKSLYRV